MKHRVSGYVIAAGVWHRSLRIDYIHFFYENDYIPTSSDYIQGSALIYTVVKDAFRCLFYCTKKAGLIFQSCFSFFCFVSR